MLSCGVYWIGVMLFHLLLHVSIRTAQACSSQAIGRIARYIVETVVVPLFCRQRWERESGRAGRCNSGVEMESTYLVGGHCSASREEINQTKVCKYSKQTMVMRRYDVRKLASQIVRAVAEDGAGVKEVSREHSSDTSMRPVCGQGFGII